jgi:type III pantothenate kinase
VTNIVIDYGNSRIKVGVFQDSILSKQESLSTDELKVFLSQPHDNVIVSSVKADGDEVLNLSHASGKKIALTPQTWLPIQIQYSTPQTLGVDRIASACGARQLFPDDDCLVIDLGTCINYELIDRSGVYHGGIISPGMNMRLKAMHTFTARLPLVQPVDNPTLIGDSTIACMQSGVMNGILEEMRGIIQRLKLEHPHLRVILTGGDYPFFENQLKPSIFAAPELVLLGLNRILIHNVKI